MKNNFKRIIYTVLIVIAIFTFSLFAKQYLLEKSQNNNSNSKLQDNISVSYSSLNLIEAYVTKVIDGDTIWVKINNEEKKVRFIGIDCPEYTKEVEAYGKEATEYTTKNLLNKTIYLQEDTTNTDSYDRLLRYVWTEKIDEINDETVSNYLFNYALCFEGLAESKYYKPNILLQDYLNKAQTNAKENKRGMWK